ncbi:MAG TPA: ATP-binding protein [Lachnospiraceae bacterium]|nr:ATP-binding protein [Lachnospiraceae bacterium]
MGKLVLDASKENLYKINELIESELEDFPPKVVMQLELIAEEIYVNIVDYAYKDKPGQAVITGELSDGVYTLTFEDTGAPFNPLLKEDPDINASAKDRQIGGLGIFLTKKLMDDVKYEYKDGKNILTVFKNTVK